MTATSLPVAALAISAPRRHRVALGALIVGTALLYLVGLGASGWANSFYSAAAQAASVSWKALLFGSSDAANAITVDKTPGALWIMGLSVRLFGVNPWSVLVPQALEGVGAVWLLYAAVRRVAGPAAGLTAGLVCALTPVAVLMFRFNNPDALLVLLLVAAAYAVTRALERGSGGWLALAGALVGFGFLAKMLQAFLVLPAFAAVYLVAAPVRPWRRLAHLAVAAGALVVSAGWYLLLVSLWPAADRPYIGGTQHNSILELTLGYNGFGRLTGAETGGLGNTNFDAGWGRLLGDQMGGQIGWLLPAALICLVAGLVLTRGVRVRAALGLWGGWLVVTGAVFSFAQGILHPYYTVALAPAIGACVAIGGRELWRRRAAVPARITLAGTMLITTVLAGVLLGRDDWMPRLRLAVAVLGVGAAVLLLVVDRLPRRAVAVVLALAVFSAGAAPTAYAMVTAATPHAGAIPSAGPTTRPGGRGGGPGGPSGQPAPGTPASAAGPNTGAGITPNGGAAPHRGSAPNSGTAPNTGPPGTNGGTAIRGQGGGRPFGFGMGGVLGSVAPSAAVTSALRADAGSYTWAAATVGSNSAAGYQLASGAPVLAIGGFNGTDPSPTLAEFQRDVAAHRIHYFITGAGEFGRHGSTMNDTAQQITEWVTKNYQPTTIGSVTLYELG